MVPLWRSCMNPGVGIMTVPSRTQSRLSLTEKLNSYGVNPYVSIDTHLQGCWFNWKRTAKMIQDNGHTHALILQDDVLLCKDFYKEYLQVLDKEPNKPICLFTPYQLPRGMYERKYVISAQGISIPVDMLDGLFEWVDNNHNPTWKYDDCRLN